MSLLDDLGFIDMDEGVAASHPPRSLPLYVAPATRDAFKDTKNTMRMTLDPIACWRLNDARFEFDSSFVNGDARQEVRQLAKMIKMAPEAPLSIFGHADPVGQDVYNLVLAQRRARSIHCILTRDLDEWKDLYNTPHGGDNWPTLKVEALMLTAIGYSPAVDDVKQFQRDFGLADDGAIGKDSRPVLVKRYMDWMCPVTLKKEAFLGGGKDKKGKGDYQSCGEFNAVLLLNDQEENKADPSDPKNLQRNADNAVNRRVVIFFYQPGTVVDPTVWPCPAAPRTDGEAASAKVACKKRFWRDFADRIKPLAAPAPAVDPTADPPPAPLEDNDKLTAKEQTTGNREFKERQRTMACRFYQRMAGWSPCEGGKKVKYWPIRLLTHDGAPPPQNGKPLANIPFVATVVGQGSKRTVGATDDNGIMRIREHDEDNPTTFEVHLQVEKDKEKVILFHAGDLKALPPVDNPDDRDRGVWQRLFNMGYTERDPRIDPFSKDEFQQMVNAFQDANGISEPNWKPDDGVSDATRDKIRAVYENEDAAGGSSSGGSP